MFGIWIQRNKAIFGNVPINIQLVINKIRSSFREQKTRSGGTKTRVLKAPSFYYEMRWSFFDWACQGNHNECGACIIIYLSLGTFFKLKLGIGRGTNTKELVLWGLFF